MALWWHHNSIKDIHTALYVSAPETHSNLFSMEMWGILSPNKTYIF